MFFFILYCLEIDNKKLCAIKNCKNKIDNIKLVDINDKRLIWITIFNDKIKNYEIKENLNLSKIDNLYLPNKV